MANLKLVCVIGAVVAMAVASSAQQQSSGGLFSFPEMVTVGPSRLPGYEQTGRYVHVNVPFIFNMDLDTRGPNQGLRMDQSILSGLVRVSMDRVRTDDGKRHGPIKVNVLGMTMFDNKAPTPSIVNPINGFTSRLPNIIAPQ